ncbi:hypothetical protein EV359DRAFT_62105 [Lentinula novae-zelandiae]|nr:hypothetical protein EV359DRAFT_62105 [Lentinula novae-zelandiae]
MDASTYAGQLFPQLGSEQKKNEVEKQYSGLKTILNQVNHIMGEVILICPSYYMLNACNEHGSNTFGSVIRVNSVRYNGHKGRYNQLTFSSNSPGHTWNGHQLLFPQLEYCAISQHWSNH